MQKNDRPHKTHEFVQFCQKHRLKVTPQRVAIYQELVKSDAHPSADSNFQNVKRYFPNISFDTVNRTLTTFADIGIMDVVEIFGGAKRFDPNVKIHHHLHCTQCGQVIDYYNRDLDNMAVPVDLHNKFLVTRKRVVFNGVCKACNK